MFSLQYNSIFTVANINNQPAIIITNDQCSKVYFPTNLHCYFGSTNCQSLLAYKDNKMWIYEERQYCGQTVCQVGFDNPPNLAWKKFIT